MSEDSVFVLLKCSILGERPSIICIDVTAAALNEMTTNHTLRRMMVMALKSSTSPSFSGIAFVEAPERIVRERGHQKR